MKTILFYANGLIIALMLAGSPVCAASNSDDLEKGLQLMREEEKLAHDVYRALYEKWQIPVFNNIAKAESRHYDAVGYLLETYAVEDPALKKEGKFRNKELADLYDQLLEKGNTSIIAAFEVGAYIEELDIQDLLEQLSAGYDEQVNTVFENLERASEVHLRAFNSQLNLRGVEYSPQVMDDATFLAITQIGNRMFLRKRMNASPRFRGNGNCVMAQNSISAAPGFRMRRNCMVTGSEVDASRQPNFRQNMRMRNKGQGMRYNCIYN